MAEVVAISLGAGVQSSAMALMAAHGEITPMPRCAIFADTGWEPAAVYDWLAVLETGLPFPVIRARRPGLDLGEMAMQIAQQPVTRTAMPPWYTAHPYGMLPRQCSKEFKTRVVARELAKLRDGNDEVELWLGISVDEMQRMKDAERKFIKHRFPLIDQRISRQDCLKWMERNGYAKPPKSSCIFCPYRSDAQWRDMKDNHPKDWADVVAFERQIRTGFYGMEGEAFIHRQRVPLDEADLSTAEDHGQLNFLSECEGMCGV